MQKWKQELEQLDSKSNHKKLLNKVLEAFLTSHYADEVTERANAIVLFNHFKKIL